MEKLVKHLKQLGILRTPRIIEAFLANDRAVFVAPEFREQAYFDIALPIGHGQSISQPYTVAFMMELLDARPGMKILDVGTGSGWTTAILAKVVGEEGQVYGLEIKAEVYEFGRANLQRFFQTKQSSLPHPNPLRSRRGRKGEVGNGFEIGNITLFNWSGWAGLSEFAPFDRILVSAAAPEVPRVLREQLAAGGKMVIPIGQNFASEVRLIEKLSGGKFREQSFSGFAFVPLVK